MMEDWLIPSGRVRFRPLQDILVCGASHPDCSDGRDRPGPRKCFADHEIPVTQREGVFFRHSTVLENDGVVLTQSVPQFRDGLLVSDPGCPPGNDDRAETRLSALLEIGADDAHVSVRALEIPTARIAWPMLGPVQDVFPTSLVVPGNQPDSDGMGARMVKVRRPAEFAYCPPCDVFAAWIARGFAEPFTLLFFRAEPGYWHEGQAIHEQYRGETRIYRCDLFRDDLQIHIADATAAILLGKEAHRKAELVTLDVGSFEALECLLWVWFFVGCPDEWL